MSAATHAGHLLRPALDFLSRTALVADSASYRYGDLLAGALAVSGRLDAAAGAAAQPEDGSVGVPAGSSGQRVALMCEAGAGYVAGTWGVWLRRDAAVPLCLSHPDKEVQYVLEDAGVSAVLASPQHAERMVRLAAPFGAPVLCLDPAELTGSRQAQQQAGSGAEGGDGSGGLGPLGRAEVERRLGAASPEDPALLVYTSGTTGAPKGALHTQRSLLAQVRALAAAWEVGPADHVLHALPLHHVHGIVNALYCPLYRGAAVEALPRFSPDEAWRRLARHEDPVTVLMAVPTMYSFLLSSYDKMPAQGQATARAGAARLRLAVSGSAACPLPVMQRWEELSGQRLLERYGMTETGMILGNPLHGERRPGSVGLPFEGVAVRVEGPDGSDAPPGEPGELLVAGEQLCSGYWGRPEATAGAFDARGFFRTGDTAVLEGPPGQAPYYRLLGRTSVDVIKRGGYKVSALSVESALLEHPAVAEAAVVGVPDEVYGEIIAAVLVPRGGANAAAGGLSTEEVRAWAAERLPRYELPDLVRVMPGLGRNAMGKVNKKALKTELFPPPAS